MRIYKGLVFIILLLFWGCRKNPAPENDGGDTGTQPLVGRLSYGDTLFFSGNSDTLLDPVSKPAPAGYFKAIPQGLALDTVTGRINKAQSETGLRYKIYYVGTNGLRIDSVKLVFSGIDYKDSIYQIARDPVLYDTAFPIYNARPDLPLPCPDADDDDGDSNPLCIFDETDLDNDGDDDIAGVIQEKLLIDPKRGFIDVEASFQAGIFGSNPASGVSKDFKIYYRLQDGSNMALNEITVRVYHFRTYAEIPQELLDEMNTRRGLSAQINTRRRGGFSNGQNARDFFLENRPKRPPMIIIVSQ